MEHHLSSVKNGCRLLKLFLGPAREWGVTELSRQLDLSKGAVHKLLATLESEGFIRQNETNKQYSLGFSLLELGMQVLKTHSLVDFAHSYLQKLAESTTELACLCLLDGEEAIYVDKIESVHPIRFNVDAYRKFPLYATSASRAILAYQPEETIDRVLAGGIRAFTKHSVTDPAEMKKRILRIRENGYEVSSNLRNVGVTGIASPIHDAAGQVVASVSLIGPSDRMQPNLDSYLVRVKATTQAISSELGWRSGL
ncbi:IclR family transcriptional regulator [Paenibacillus sp. J31TS4]|uniref:IclR family transcriptional regulator n=1 Tax=Paenibacillus sp. J31TS4 TaxID=2807195 RepID=UPI001B1DE575|nr:IclR family transcriptional regulator [Paenibacillus sp. J31TS4]GIP40076.1 IclR family transcriptional regulator [Paenibacillus sp. J31TS4]